MLTNGLDLCITQGSKGLPVTNTLAYRAYLLVVEYCKYGA